MNPKLKSVSALLAASTLALVTGVTAQEQAAAPAQDAPAAAPAPAEAAPAEPVQEEVYPPSINGIPGESIQEGGKFAKIDLSKYVSDEVDKPEAIKWAVTGQKQLKVTLNGSELTIETPDKYWNGSEDLTFTATNSKGKSATETVNFSVESVNNPPEFAKQIEGQSINEKQEFKTIKLDDYINDVDHKKSEITWEASVQPVGKDQADGDLEVQIGADHVAKIVIPNKDWYGTAEITFTATDPEYASVSSKATFEVKPVNDTPVLKQIPNQTIEEKNTFESINLADYVTDIDDEIEQLKWTVTGNKELKVNIDKYGTAEITLPDENWSGPAETLTFTVTDPKGASASTKATFEVKPINDPPEFVDAIPDQTIDEKQQFKVIELDKYVKDIDHKFEQLKWTVTGNKDLKVQISGKEAKVTTPNALWNGEESITFKVTDPAGASAETTAMFTVNSVNDAPVFAKQIPDQTIDEKKQFQSIKLDDFISDADHKKEEISWDVSVKHQGKEPESGTLDVVIDENRVAKINIPDVNWNGAVVATFTATDPDGASIKQDVKLTVKSVNDLPKFTTAIPDQTIEEKGEFEGFSLDDYIADADHSNDKLKFEVSGNKDLKISIDKNRSVSIKTPSELWNGTEKVTFTATDPEGGVAKQVVTFTAKSVNDAPVMKDIPGQSIKEKGQFKEIDLSQYVSDLDHDFSKLKWTISGNKDLKVQISGKTAKVTTPNAMWNGEETIKFKVTDPEGASDEREATFTVESVNDVPEFVKQLQDQTINEKQQFKPIKLEELVKDADNKFADLKWDFAVKSLKGSSSEGLSVNVENGVANIVIPNKYWNGAAEITFKVTDPEGASASSKATFTVNSVNDAPVFAQPIKDQTIQEKSEFQSFSLAELVNDADHDFSKLKIDVQGNKDLKVNVSKDGVVSVKQPSNLWYGSEKVTFTITDPEGASAKQTVTFTVNSVNDAPVMKDIPAQTIKEKGQFKDIDLGQYVTDLDHDFAKLKWTVTGNKDLKVQISGKTAKVLTPNAMWHGAETLKFTVTDPEGASDSRDVTFTVESVNDVPEFVKQVPSQSINEKQQFKPIKLDELVKDLDHKVTDLKWDFEVKPAKGSADGLQVKVDQNRMANIVIPNKFWNGSADIIFKVTDPEGASATSKATFTVNSVNDAPVFAQPIKDQSIKEKGSFQDFNLAELVKDEDHDFSKLKVAVTGNKDLKVNVSKDGMVSVKTPNELWNGTEKVTFTVTDPEGASAKQTVTFAVASVNDAPEIVKQIPDQKIKEKGEFKVIVLDQFVKDLDHPANKLKWTVEGAKTLKFAIDGQHNLKVNIPNKYWHGEEKIKLTVTDPEGASASQDVVFTVESVNDAPAFVKDLQNQTIDEKKQFQPIKLNDFVKDFDHKPEQLKWSYTAEAYSEAAPAKGKKKADASSKETDLKVNIGKDGVANLVIPNKYWHGAAKITFTVTDPEGAKASSSAIYTVRSVNDLPVISPNAPAEQIIREGEKFNIIVLNDLATDADHPASVLKWEITGNKDLKVVRNKDNTVNVNVPHGQWNGRENLTFTVTDPEGAKATHRMAFAVTPVNDPPKIGKIAGQKIKEKAKFNPVKLDDFVKDPDNKPSEMKWTVLNAKDIKKGLKVEVTPSRQLNVTAENPYFWCAPQPVKLKVTDPNGASDTTTVVYEITSVNDAPVMKDIPGQKIREKGEFKDINLDQFVKDPDHKLEQLIWTATVAKAADPSAEKAKAKKPAKKAKKGAKAEPAAQAPAEPDMTVSIDAKHVAHILLPSKYWSGARNITFTAKDPEGATVSKTALFEVESVNDAPEMKTIPAQTIKEKEHFAPIDLADIAHDPDHPTSSLKYEVSGARALKASINAKKQLIVATPDKYWSGNDKVTLTVTDPEGAKATQQIQFNVTPVNDPPKISKLNGQTIKEKEKFQPIDLGAAVTDPDNKPNELKWTVSGNKDLKVEFRGTRAMVTTPNEFWNGTETLTFRVTDPSGAFDEAKATFKVTPVNDAPKFVGQVKPFEIQEKQQFKPINMSEFVKDPDNKTSELVFTIDDGLPPGKDKKGKPTKAKGPTTKHALDYSFDDKGVLTVTVPNSLWNGQENVTVNAFDPSGEKASAQFRFVVTPVNDVPVVSEIPGEMILEGKQFKTISLDKYVKDPDNKPSEIKWTVKNTKNLIAKISDSRVATISSRPNWSGDDYLTFVARDPSGATAQATAKFTVKHVNAVPEMKDLPNITVKENELNSSSHNGGKGVLAVYKLQQIARDKDHKFNDLKWSWTGNKFLTVKYDKIKQTITVAQPYDHWKGAPEKITLTVTDPEGAKVSKTVTYTVVAVNNPPEAISQHYQTQEGTKLVVSAAEGLMNGSSDPDNEQPVRAMLVSKPQNGTINLNEKDGSFTYEPKKGFSGLDEFTFKLADKGGAMSAVTTAEVNVTFKMRDVRGGSKPAAAPAKKEDPKKADPKDDKKSKGKKKKGKK